MFLSNGQGGNGGARPIVFHPGANGHVSNFVRWRTVCFAAVAIFLLDFGDCSLTASVRRVASFKGRARDGLFLPISRRKCMGYLVVVMGVVLGDGLGNPFAILFFNGQCIGASFSLYVNTAQVTFNLFARRNGPTLCLGAERKFIHLVHRASGDHAVSLSQEVFVAGDQLGASIRYVAGARATMVGMLLANVRRPLHGYSRMMFSYQGVDQGRGATVGTSLFSPCLVFASGLIVPICWFCVCGVTLYVQGVECYVRRVAFPMGSLANDVV